MEIGQKKHSLWFCAVLLIVVAFLTRLVGILYSITATDILYEKSILPTVLLYGRQGLEGFFWGCGFGFAAVFLQNGEKKRAIAAALIHTAMHFLYTMSALVIDWRSGSLTEVTLWPAVAVNTLNFLFTALLIWLAFYVTSFWICRKRMNGGLLIGCGVYLLGQLGVQTVYVVQFLLSVSFQPYTTELVEIGKDYLSILVLCGGAAMLSAWMIWKLLLKNETNKSCLA